MPAPVLRAGAVAGWDLHPLEAAAFSRRTPVADIVLGAEFKEFRIRSDPPVGDSEPH